jgi:hypothetical protein
VTICQDADIVSERSKISILPSIETQLSSYFFYNISIPVEIFLIENGAEKATLIFPQIIDINGPKISTPIIIKPIKNGKFVYFL